jgi:hypothetical protein
MANASLKAEWNRRGKFSRCGVVAHAGPNQYSSLEVQECTDSSLRFRNLPHSFTSGTSRCAFLSLATNIRDQAEGVNDERAAKNEIQELHAKEVGVGNPSEERASS